MKTLQTYQSLPIIKCLSNFMKLKRQTSHYDTAHHLVL